MNHRHPGGGRVRASLLLVLTAIVVAGPGCYSSRFKAMDQSMYALQARADSLAQAHDRTRAELADLKAQVGEHANQLRSLRAGSETSNDELLRRIEQLETTLEEQRHQIDDLAGRTRTRSSVLDSTTAPAMPAPVAPAPATKSNGSAKPPAKSGAGTTGAAATTGAAGTTAVQVDPTAAYDQAVLDFTQGRFDRSLDEFRDFVGKYPSTDLADNAQYGVGESYYAQGKYDSSIVAYREVVDRWPDADKVPAALYKLGIAYQKSNRSPEARTTFQTLTERYPRSGEARLAEERLREMDRR